jgi:hypothetical protein
MERRPLLGSGGKVFNMNKKIHFDFIGKIFNAKSDLNHFRL